MRLQEDSDRPPLAFLSDLITDHSNIMTRVLKHFVVHRSVALLCADLSLLFVTTSLLQNCAIYLHVDAARLTANTITIPIFVTIIATLAIATMGFYRWDFCWDRRSWILRIIMACCLAVVVLARSLLYPEAALGSPEIQVPGVGFYISVIAAFVVGIHALRSGPRLLKRRILLIGSGKRAANIEELARCSNGTIAIVRRAHVDDAASLGTGIECITSNSILHEHIGEVVIAVDDQRGLPMNLLLQWKLAGIRVIDYLTFWERECGRVDLGAACPAWFVFGDGCRRSRFDVLAKRCFDVLVSAFLLALTAPLLAVCAALIWLESGGPILYRQDRVGRCGRSFTLLKLRSMRPDAEGSRPQWALAKDPRTTRIGSIIRQLRVDEIPQLWNVLRNDMSLIGPRPERPFFVEQLAEAIPYYQDRHWVKPGITGWAQINFPYGASISDAAEKLSYDLYYVKNSSMLLDLFITLSTIRVILFQEGAR